MTKHRKASLPPHSYLRSCPIDKPESRWETVPPAAGNVPRSRARPVRFDDRLPNRFLFISSPRARSISFFCNLPSLHAAIKRRFTVGYNSVVQLTFSDWLVVALYFLFNLAIG